MAKLDPVQKLIKQIQQTAQGFRKRQGDFFSTQQNILNVTGSSELLQQQGAKFGAGQQQTVIDAMKRTGLDEKSFDQLRSEAKEQISAGMKRQQDLLSYLDESDIDDEIKATLRGEVEAFTDGLAANISQDFTRLIKDTEKNARVAKVERSAMKNKEKMEMLSKRPGVVAQTLLG